MCLITAPSSVWRGRVENMSFTGVSVLFSGSPQDSLIDTLLELPGVTLKVSPVGMVRKLRKTLVHFQVVSVESGEELWRSLHNARWRAALPGTQADLMGSSHLEGRTLNLNEQSLAVVLPEPVFADRDCVQVILTAHDGSLLNLTGRVVRQHQTTIGEVVVGIQLAELSVEATTSLIEKCAPHSPFTMEADPFQYPEPCGLRGWIHALLSHPPAPPADRRRIPRLPIHATCAILRPEMTP